MPSGYVETLPPCATCRLRDNFVATSVLPERRQVSVQTDLPGVEVTPSPLTPTEIVRGTSPVEEIATEGVRQELVLSLVEIEEETAVSFVDRLVSDDVPARVFLRLHWDSTNPEVYRLEISGSRFLVRGEEGDRVWEAMEALARGDVLDPLSDVGTNGTSPTLLDPWGSVDEVPEGWL